MPRSCFTTEATLVLEVELNREPHQTPLQDAGRSPARASHYKRCDRIGCRRSRGRLRCHTQTLSFNQYSRRVHDIEHIELSLNPQFFPEFEGFLQSKIHLIQPV